MARVRDIATGADFDVFNTHLDEHRPENRLRSIEELVGWLRPDQPTIVLGDLNATPSDPSVAALRESGLEPVVPTGNLGTTHQFSGVTTGCRIDHIVVSRHWTIRAATVEHFTDPLPSDHWPVVASLCLRHADGKY